MTLRWVIAGGGTGGHVTPALALGERIRQRGDHVHFIGSSHGLEARLLPEQGFELSALPSDQVMGQGLAARVRSALGLLALSVRARAVLRAERADLVVSVGGYAAMPAVIAAVVTRTPLFLVEPNALPGRVNRLSARFARRAFVGFQAAAAHLRTRRPVECFGVPVRAAQVGAFTTRGEARESDGPLRIFVTGGSQGARQLNENVPAALAALDSQPLSIVHQTGEPEQSLVASRYAELGLDAEVVAFEKDMPARFAWADLVICRAGALTLAELCLAGVPALLVPYPFAADDHQAKNARALEKAGAAVAVDAHGLDVERLTEALRPLVADRARLVDMGRAARGLARPNAAKDIVETCARIVGGGDPHEAGRA